jgi:hypothetical protein
MAAKKRKVLETEAERLRELHPDKSMDELVELVERNKRIRAVEKAKATRKANQEKKSRATPQQQAAKAVATAARATAQAASALADNENGDDAPKRGSMMHQRYEDARADLEDDLILGPGVSGKAQTLSVWRLKSPGYDQAKIEQKMGISYGWLEDLDIGLRPHLRRFISDKYGGGTYDIIALMDGDKKLASGTLSLAGKPKKPETSSDDDDDDDDDDSGVNPFFGPMAYPPGYHPFHRQAPQVNPVLALEKIRKEEREEARTRLNEIRLQMQADREAREAREERDKEERIAREDRLAKEASERRAEEERRREDQRREDARREERRQEREEKAARESATAHTAMIQAMQASTTQMMTMMTQVQSTAMQSQQAMMTAMLGKQDLAGKAAIEAMSRNQQGAASMQAELFKTLRVSLESQNSQTTTDRMISAAMEVLPEVGKTVSGLFPNASEREANKKSKTIETSVHDQARETIAQLQRQDPQAGPSRPQDVLTVRGDEPVWTLPDQRKLPLRIAQAMAQEFQNAGYEPSPDLLNRGLTEWADKVGVPIPPSRALAAPAPAQPPVAASPPVAAQAEPAGEDAPSPAGGPWMGPTCPKEMMALLNAGIAPLESVQHLLKKGLLSEKARKEIGVIGAEVLEDDEATEEQMVQNLMGAIGHLLAQHDVTVPVSFTRFATDEAAQRWLVSFLWVCGHDSMEDAVEAVRILSEVGEETEAEAEEVA